MVVKVQEPDPRELLKRKKRNFMKNYVRIRKKSQDTSNISCLATERMVMEVSRTSGCVKEARHKEFIL